ncbi:MAG TPA: GNAT family N-acetyltransferase, partial [Solirubrobacteraceae bacterium]|nr:GNAT family N-acetyltransferase [Solirubrobacteraceae bacterium]
VIAWWRHLAPARAAPFVVVVRDGDALAGLAPLYAQGGLRGAALGLRLPGGELGGRLAPLAVRGREATVAQELARALAAGAPHAGLVTLEDMPLQPDWSAALRERWPGRRRPVCRRYQLSASPTVALREDSFESWLSAKSSNFRREMRRLRRQFAAAGGATRTSTPATLVADVEAFVRLHAARWQDRGSSFTRLGARLGAVLNDIGAELLAREGRFRMRVLELDGQPVSAQLFLAAGGRVLYVNGGWDERYARLKPSMLGILDTIEEAFERGERCVDLGPGEQHYKQRFADGDDPLAWTVLVPPGPGMPLRTLRVLAPRGEAALRGLLKARLSERQLARLRRLRAGVAGDTARLQDTG